MARLEEAKFAVPRPVGKICFAKGGTIIMKAATGNNNVVKRSVHFDRDSDEEYFEDGFVAQTGQSNGVSEAPTTRAADSGKDDQATIMCSTDDSCPKTGAMGSLNTGEQFEWVPKTVMDLMKRYIPISYSQDKRKATSKEDNSHKALWSNTIAVKNQPMHPMAQLYGGWRGSLKYRIFMNSAGAFSRVFYIPASGQHDYVRDEQNTMVNTLIGEVTEEEENGVHCEISGEVWTQTAFEIPFINSNKGYIDVMIPYQDILRFRQIDQHTGFLCIAFNGIITNPDTNKSVQVFQSIGDDFAVGCFHAVPKEIIYRVVQVKPPAGKKLVNRKIPFGLSGLQGEVAGGDY